MTFLSMKFFIILFFCLIVYYILPVKFRWIALLAASVVFYLLGGKKITAVILVTAAFAYFAAIRIEKSRERGDEKSRQKLYMAIGILVLLGILACTKISSYLEIGVGLIIVPVGISYYTLSLVGYILDVYWKKDKAEKNFLHFLTFVMFFPKILQGPISSHKVVGAQLIEGHKFDYREFCFGAQLIIWGMFKKVVLADRMSIFTSSVYANPSAETGAILLVTMILSALQLYCDFSGYTDIALGVAQMFGIQLEQNFNHPFFAKSASEWWQRWHMTLSGWFKDYLFLPVSRSKAVKNLSRKMGEKHGPSARKKTMIAISSAVVWLATGLWHGTGINYIVWGAYWGTIIILSEIFSAQLEKLNNLLHIKTESFAWKLFQMLRTGLIFIVGKMISAQDSLADVGNIIHNIFANFKLESLSTITEKGLAGYDFGILIVGMLIILIVSIQQEKGIVIRERIAEWPDIIRWTFFPVALTVIILLGVYGLGYDTSGFAYQYF